MVRGSEADNTVRTGPVARRPGIFGADGPYDCGLAREGRPVPRLDRPTDAEWSMKGGGEKVSLHLQWNHCWWPANEMVL